MSFKLENMNQSDISSSSSAKESLKDFKKRYSFKNNGKKRLSKLENNSKFKRNSILGNSMNASKILNIITNIEVSIDDETNRIDKKSNEKEKENNFSNKNSLKLFLKSLTRLNKNSNTPDLVMLINKADKIKNFKQNYSNNDSPSSNKVKKKEKYNSLTSNQNENKKGIKIKSKLKELLHLNNTKSTPFLKKLVFNSISKVETAQIIYKGESIYEQLINEFQVSGKFIQEEDKIFENKFSPKRKNADKYLLSKRRHGVVVNTNEIISKIKNDLIQRKMNKKRDSLRIMTLLKLIPDFKNYYYSNCLTDEALLKSVEYIIYMYVKPGEYIIRQGDTIDGFYCILLGEVDETVNTYKTENNNIVSSEIALNMINSSPDMQIDLKIQTKQPNTKNDFIKKILKKFLNTSSVQGFLKLESKIMTYSQGKTFGDLGNLEQISSNSNFVSKTECHILKISRFLFETLFKKCVLKEEMKRKEFLILTIPDLKEVNSKVFNWFYKTINFRNYKKEELIINQTSSKPKYIYLIMSGECLRITNKGKINQEMTIISKGGIFGFNSLTNVNNDKKDIEKYEATVISKTNSKVMEIPVESLLYNNLNDTYKYLLRLKERNEEIKGNKQNTSNKFRLKLNHLRLSYCNNDLDKLIMKDNIEYLDSMIDIEFGNIKNKNNTDRYSFGKFNEFKYNIYTNINNKPSDKNINTTNTLNTFDTIKNEMTHISNFNTRNTLDSIVNYKYKNHPKLTKSSNILNIKNNYKGKNKSKEMDISSRTNNYKTNKNGKSNILPLSKESDLIKSVNIDKSFRFNEYEINKTNNPHLKKINLRKNDIFPFFTKRFIRENFISTSKRHIRSIFSNQPSDVKYNTGNYNIKIVSTSL